MLWSERLVGSAVHCERLQVREPLSGGDEGRAGRIAPFSNVGKAYIPGNAPLGSYAFNGPRLLITSNGFMIFLKGYFKMEE